MIVLLHSTASTHGLHYEYLKVCDVPLFSQTAFQALPCIMLATNIKGQVQCFSMQIVLKKCLVINPGKILAQILWFSRKTTRRIYAKFFQVKGKHLLITTCIKKHCTWPLRPISFNQVIITVLQASDQNSWISNGAFNWAR